MMPLNKLCPRTPRQELDAIIDNHKSCGREFDSLDLEDAQEICALVGLKWGSEQHNDVLDKVDASLLLSYMRHGQAEYAGEYLFTKMQDFLTQFAEQEYNDYVVDDGDRLDQAYDRFKDDQMMRDM